MGGEELIRRINEGYGLFNCKFYTYVAYAFVYALLAQYYIWQQGHCYCYIIICPASALISGFVTYDVSRIQSSLELDHYLHSG